MIRFCNDCIHFGVCMGFSNCKSFERRENANMRITGYEVDGGKLSAVYITDETRGIEQKKFEDRPHGEWIEHRQFLAMGYFFSEYECSNCHDDVWQKTEWQFCPSCGASMIKKEGERNE